MVVQPDQSVSDHDEVAAKDSVHWRQVTLDVSVRLVA